MTRHAAKQLAHRRGLTLVELLLALAGTALIGLAIAAMMFAVAYGTQSDRDLRELVVKEKTIDARLSAAIRGSQMVLDQGDDYLVLWTYDTDDSGAPNLSEIRRIERDADDELISYTAPDDLDPGDDTVYALADDFAAITQAIKGGATFPASLWGTAMTAWTIALNDADAQSATLVSYRFTLAAGRLDDTAVNAAALRNQERLTE